MPRLQSFLAAALAVLIAGSAGAEERPNAMRLFPGTTVFFVRTPDRATLRDKFTGSEFFRDPEIKPFLGSLAAKVDAAFREDEGLGGVFGGGLWDFLDLFQGEVALGVVPRTNASPAVVAIADTLSAGDRAAADAVVADAARDRVDRLLAAIEAAAPRKGNTIARERIGSAEAFVLRQGDNADTAFALVERDGVLLLATDPLLMESVLAKWDAALGVAPPADAPADAPPADDAPANDEAKRLDRQRKKYAAPLADNAAFTEALRQCVEERIGGGDGSPPNLMGFLDPVGVFRSVAQRSAGLRVALATLPILGLDGFQGAAGAAWIDTGDWDALARGHLLLDTPRAGLLKMARLQPVDSTPPPCVPADATEYVCGGINLAATLDGAGQLYDRIRGEGEFAKLVDSGFTDRVGLAPDDLMTHLTGRFVSMQAFADPPAGEALRATPNRALLVGVTDADWATTKLEETVKKLAPEAQWFDHAGVRCVLWFDPDRGDPDQTERLRRRTMAEMTGMMTCGAVIDGDLVFAQTRPLLDKLLDTRAGELPGLADHLPYRLTASRAARLGAGTVGGTEGRALSYSDPAPQFRRWIAAADSDASRQELDRMAEVAPPMRWLRDTLDEVGTPPLEALLRHAAPSGAALFDTPTGFRWVAFSFKTQSSGDTPGAGE